ncbi:MAG: DUF6382 domain-containing protein [bacterium]|nr:DUF6382 domain-containing protein [bacterium]
MGQREVTYQAIGENTYLVIMPPAEAKVIPYLTKMVENNKILGLLPMASQTIDGRTKFSYEITRKSRLIDVVSGKQVGAAQGEKIIGNLVQALLRLDRYFLRMSQCVLETEYIFVDDAWNVYLPYYPVEIQGMTDGNKAVSEFFLNLLGTCFITEERVEYYDKLMRFLIMPGFSLAKFQEIVITKKEAQAVSSKPMEQTNYKKTEQNSLDVAAHSIIQKKEEKGLLKKEVKRQNDSWQDSIAIPGGGSRAENVEIDQKPERLAEKNKVEKKKRDGKSFFGFSFRKKESQNLNMEEDIMMIPAGAKKEEKNFSTPNIPGRTFGGENRKNKADDFAGTIQMNEELNATVILGEGARKQPYLLYQGRKEEITKQAFKIGRSGGDFAVQKKTVSEPHAQIACIQDSYYLTDLNSTNHTYLNGTMIDPYKPQELHNADVIRLADQEMTFYEG